MAMEDMINIIANVVIKQQYVINVDIKHLVVKHIIVAQQQLVEIKDVQVLNAVDTHADLVTGMLGEDRVMDVVRILDHCIIKETEILFLFIMFMI